MIPPDVLSDLFTYLSLLDLMECSGVCLSWRDSALHEIFRRTNQSLSDMIRKHKNLNKSILLKTISKTNKKFSAKALFQKISFDSALISGNTSKLTFASDFDMYPSLCVSMRWYTFPINLKPKDLTEYRWCLTTPLFSQKQKEKQKEKGKNKRNTPRQFCVSRGSRFHIPWSDRAAPVIVDKLISIYNIGTTVIAVWNDYRTVAFIVHSQPLSLRLLADCFHLKLPKKIISQSERLDSFGITAQLTLRNFKRVFVHEVFNNLFYEEDNVLRGWDKLVLQNISLEKGFSLLWKSDYFKGKIPGCCIVELVLKHSKTFTPDNLWDVSKYSLSQLCKLEPLPDEYKDKMPFDYSPDSSFVFKASNKLLSIEIILCFDEFKDELIFHDMSISIAK